MLWIIIVAFGVEAATICRSPAGSEGEVRVSGCNKITCTAVTRATREGVWIQSPAMSVQKTELSTLLCESFHNPLLSLKLHTCTFTP